MKITLTPKLNNIQPTKVAFKGLSKDAMRTWRILNGCPKNVDSAYDGYTGVKFFRFPTNPNLRKSSYPDVTEEYQKFQDEILDEINKVKNKPFGKIRVLGLFLKKFRTGDSWDTKFLPEFPGRDTNGKVQYARYNNKIVKGNFLSNFIYGYLCASIGISEKQAKSIAKVYSCGLLEPFINKKLPSLKAIKFRDPPDDQMAISSGVKEFKSIR